MNNNRLTAEISFAVQTKNGVVEKVGRSFIYQPKIQFKGGTVKWYKDKLKEDVVNK